MTPRDEATRRQIQAADPRGSTWLAANAGSGKTRVLTDRVARLLLAGTPPQNILCLTFTKAAASEMQNRLFRRLGDWAMAADHDLLAKLADLGVDPAPRPAELARARTLFARAVETPGGLKIQTIHSFCAAILRRFPLEAGVPPTFAEMDDRAADELQAQVLSQLAEHDPAALSGVASFLTGDIDEFVKEIINARGALDPPMDRAHICEALDVDPGLDAAAVVETTLGPDDADMLHALAQKLWSGGKTDVKLADAIARLPAPDGPDAITAYGDALLTRTGTIPKTPPTKGVRTAAPDLCEHLDDLRERLVAGRELLNGLRTAERTEALHRFAGAFLARYEAAKAARGWLDFDDLILKTRDLLRAPGLADWVLFRLDGGIDHILVDEAQDTSPSQWEVIGLLAQEIAAGAGRAEAGQRTLFVVGDQKQSIYSFQGADPREFERMRRRFAESLKSATGLTELELQHSFRSADPILRTVDSALHGQGGLGGAVSHVPFHGTMPGRVDLWPIARSQDGGDDDAPWYDPVDRVQASDGRAILAQAIADHVKAMIDRGDTLTDQNGKVRPITEGDVLILFRSRTTPLFDAVIGACKRAGLAIAGADRMKLAAELAVRDITALLAFLATPEDDLSLAAALRSPLLGWSEDALYRLAQPRAEGELLWPALRRADAPETLTLLHDMLDHADFLRPYELIERLLIRHDGRRRLLARLGDEAEDGIDVLLSQALSYEAADVPSLTGFLDWLNAGDMEVKRQAESTGGKIRVMTVHGAKGLEAPIVILPETIRADRRVSSALLPDAAGRVFWKPNAPDMPAALRDAAEMLAAKDRAEEERLLYVAMTRAESWLIAAGAWDRDKLPDNAWYGRIEAGLIAEGAGPCDTPLGQGLRLESGRWGNPGTPGSETATPPPPPALPAWTDRPVTPRPHATGPVSPSDLGGAKALPGEGDTPEQAMARGTDLHRLLEVLPGCPTGDRADMAASVLPVHSPDERAALLAEAERLLDAADLRPLFAPGTLAEVQVTARPDPLSPRPLLGTVDRLVVAPDAVLVVDYKTNRVVPERAEDVPEGVLRQMGAYAAALASIYRGRRIDTAILWTAVPRLQHLPARLTTAALMRAAAP